MSITPEQMRTAVAAAMKAISKSATAEEPIAVGCHQVDTTVSIRVKGVLEKCPMQEFEATPKINWAVALALLAKRLKAKRPDGAKVIGEVLRDTIAFGDDVPKTLGFPDRVSDAEKQINDSRFYAAKVPSTKEGALKWSGESSIEMK